MDAAMQGRDTYDPYNTNKTIINGMYLVTIEGTEYYCVTSIQANNLKLMAEKTCASHDSKPYVNVYTPVQ